MSGYHKYFHTSDHVDKSAAYPLGVCVCVTHYVKMEGEGRLGGSVVEDLPLAQGVIPESWDQVLHQAPQKELLFLLPVSLPISLCLS